MRNCARQVPSSLPVGPRTNRGLPLSGRRGKIESSGTADPAEPEKVRPPPKGSNQLACLETWQRSLKVFARFFRYRELMTLL